MSIINGEEVMKEIIFSVYRSEGIFKGVYRLEEKFLKAGR